MGLTRIRAEQISDIDYKQAVRVITVSNVTLTGGAPSTVDSVNLAAGDRILVSGQNTGSQNGLYTVSVLGTGSNGTWVRTSDGNTDGEIEAGMIVMVTEGTVYKDTQWKLTTNNPIIIGTTALTFEQNSAFAFGNIYANSTAVLATSVGDSLTLTPGDNIAITGNNTTRTVTISAAVNATSTQISSGTSNVKVVSSGGNVTVGVDGTNNTVVFGSSATTFASNLLPAANVTYNLGSSNQRWQDLWLANTSIYLGPVTLATVGTALTVNGANVLTGNAGAAFSTSGNVTGGNLLTLGLISAAGNITGNYLLGNGSQLSGIITSVANINNGTSIMEVTSSGGNIRANVGGTSNVQVIASSGVFITGINSVTGNIDGANLRTAGLISAAGNITTATFFIGNGSQLTGLTGIRFTSQANTPPSTPNNGDFWYDTFTDIKYQYINDGDSNQWVDQSAPTTFATISTNQILNSGSNGTGNIGSAGNYFRDLFIGNISLTGNIVDNGALWIQTGSNGNLTLDPNGTGVIIANKDIRNGQANGVGNIGSSTGQFNTIFARATSAQYADLAEMYQADQELEPGMVVVFGGAQEITTTNQDHDTRVAGVISTNPAYLMNAGAPGLPVAFTGRVPCRVRGPIGKGEVLVTSCLPGVAQRLGDRWQPGCVLGKSLQTIEDDSVRMIEIAVGRF